MVIEPRTLHYIRNIIIYLYIYLKVKLRDDDVDDDDDDDDDDDHNRESVKNTRAAVIVFVCKIFKKKKT